MRPHVAACAHEYRHHPERDARAGHAFASADDLSDGLSDGSPRVRGDTYGTKRSAAPPAAIMDPTVYARSPFHRGEEVLVPADAFGDDYAAKNPETLSGTLICIKSVERDEAGEERRIWDVRYETGPFETDESFFVRRVSIGRGRRARGFERRSRRRRGHRAQEAAAAGAGVVTREESIFYHYYDRLRVASRRRSCPGCRRQARES